MKEVDERIFLGLGSNMGDRLHNIEEAKRYLTENPRIRLVAASKIYETEPEGLTEQDWFLNAVIEIRTILTPWELLEVVQHVEKRLGRVRYRQWGPRTIDVDILVYGSQEIKEKDLIVPHPRLKQRAFVLVPLGEIAPLFELPSGETIQSLLGELDSAKKVLPVEVKDAKL